MDAPWWSCDHVYKIAPQLWGFSFQKWIKFVWLSDVSAWNAKRIRDYFSSNGFSDEVCQTILDQEIDGGSLLLLHRQDVISGLGLKLGPALKVFKQVKKLQTRRHFPSWTQPEGYGKKLGFFKNKPPSDELSIYIFFHTKFELVSCLFWFVIQFLKDVNWITIKLRLFCKCTILTPLLFFNSAFYQALINSKAFKEY